MDRPQSGETAKHAVAARRLRGVPADIGFLRIVLLLAMRPLAFMHRLLGLANILAVLLVLPRSLMAWQVAIAMGQTV